MRTPITKTLIEAAAGMQLVVLDADGVLTDGTLSYTAQGQTVERFHARDAVGLRLLSEAGIAVVAVSPRASGALARFGDDLGVAVERAKDMLAAVTRVAAARDVPLERVCFVGYDILALPAVCTVGLGVAVGNAHVTLRAGAAAVTARPGGRGAVREVADLLLHARRREVASGTGLGDFGVIIPARMASSRLPGKPLLDLAGKPMIVRVVENARRSTASFVIVATDDERIVRAVEAAGGQAVLTASDHASGTDRLAEVIDRMDMAADAVVVNVQGDEPLLDPALIDRVASGLFLEPDAEVATLATPILNPDDVRDPNIVKVIVNQMGHAVAFSRSAIPFVRDTVRNGPRKLPPPTFLRHVGVYAYRAGALRRVAAHPPVALEQAEALEQMRMLWLGIPIHVAVVDDAPAHGVDTPADLAAAERAIRATFEKAPESRRGTQ